MMFGLHSIRTMIFKTRLAASQQLRMRKPGRITRRHYNTGPAGPGTTNGSRRNAVYVAMATAVVGGAGAWWYFGSKTNRSVTMVTPPSPGSSDLKQRRKVPRAKDTQNAITICRELITNLKAYANYLQNESQCPGISVAVSVDGKTIWNQGFGYSDIENGVPCTPQTVTKLASVSKPITMLITAKLWEQGKLDLEAPISRYVKTWPVKTWHGKQVDITTRHLVSHLAGIRDYRRLVTSQSTTSSTDSNDELAFTEYYMKDKYRSVEQSLRLFKDDDLISKPGCKFNYTTHGFTLLSAVLEGATGKTFQTLLAGLCRDLGLTCTCLDDKEALVYGRSSYYEVVDGQLKNAPFTESSFKWAGAGMLSNVIDLLRFGNVILYSYQRQPTDTNLIPGYLKANTVKQLLTPVPDTAVSWDSDGSYAMGWQLSPCACADGGFLFGHSGSTVGASSMLLLFPKDFNRPGIKIKRGIPPQGIVVAVLANIQGLNLAELALDITTVFDSVYER